MKVLHTADWHLGHKLYNANRIAEHQAALDGLLTLIREEGVELLIIAGDVFDTDMPPNYARRQYYNFLSALVDSPCQNVVVVAGNHDSANMLDASGEILRLLNVHIIGNLPDDPAEQLIEIYSADGKLAALVAAVPYLRDRDVRLGAAGQTIEERMASLRMGIEQHYAAIGAAVQPYIEKDIPLICTGHLFVAGGERDGRPNSIHIGSLDVVDIDCFPKVFDYIALGHLHRPQKVAKQNHIRYAGSLIPMDFNEWNYAQSVLLLDFNNKNLESIKTVPLQLARKLKYYKGDLNYIRAKLTNYEAEAGLTSWLKIDVITTTFIPELEEELQALLDGKNAIVMLLNQMAVDASDLLRYHQAELRSLTDLQPIEVFQMRLDTERINDGDKREELEQTFLELMNWMQEEDNE